MGILVKSKYDQKKINNVIISERIFNIMTFVKGQSGNPLGRPKGVGPRQELFNQVVFPRRLEIAERMLEEALIGRNERLLLFFGERLFPKPEHIGVSFQLPDNIDEATLFKLGEEIIRMVGEGHISADQGQILTNTVKSHRDGLLLKNLMDQVKGLNDKVEKLEK